MKIVNDTNTNRLILLCKEKDRTRDIVFSRRFVVCQRPKQKRAIRTHDGRKERRIKTTRKAKAWFAFRLSNFHLLFSISRILLIKARESRSQNAFSILLYLAKIYHFAMLPRLVSRISTKKPGFLFHATFGLKHHVTCFAIICVMSY